MNPSGCGPVRGLKLIIKKSGTITQEMNVTVNNSPKIVSKLEPETEYTVEIEGDNIRRSIKKFQTIKISKKTERTIIHDAVLQHREEKNGNVYAAIHI